MPCSDSLFGYAVTALYASLCVGLMVLRLRRARESFAYLRCVVPRHLAACADCRHYMIQR